MKPKYILECYDKLLRDINNSKHIDDQKCIEAIQKISIESFVSYKVIFNNRKNTTDYSIEYPVHNLHPQAVAFENLRQDNHPELDKFVPSIFKELNLLASDVKLQWSSDNKAKFLYLSVDAKLESLSKRNLLLVYYYQLAKNENINIKKRIKDQIFKYKSKEQIEQFVHKTQSSIENLIDHIIREIKPDSVHELYELSNQYKKADYLKITYRSLEKLLLFLVSEYPTLTTENSQVPIRTLIQNKKELEQESQEIKNKLSALCSNEKLLAIALEPIEKIAEITVDKKVNYYQLKYCKQYIAACFDHFTVKQDSADSEIIDLLVELDLNSFKLFEVKIDTIIFELDQIDTTNDKIKLLFQIRKQINQKQTKILKPFLQDYPSIKTQVIGWIEEEIEFLQSSIHLRSVSQSVPSEVMPKAKIQTELSVAQLCYLFNLLHQSGVIKQSNQRDIFRFIAENFKTKTTEQISVDSIKSRYYNVESSTKNAVREKLIALLNLAKS